MFSCEFCEIFTTPFYRTPPGDYFWITRAKMFSCEFCEIFTTPFYRTPPGDYFWILGGISFMGSISQKGSIETLFKFFRSRKH